MANASRTYEVTLRVEDNNQPPYLPEDEAMLKRDLTTAMDHIFLAVLPGSLKVRRVKEE